MKRKVNPKANETGTTLIELLVAVGIMAASLVVLLLALSTAAQATRIAADMSMATALAQSQLETIKAAPYDANGAYPSISVPSGFVVDVEVSELASGKQLVTVSVRTQGRTLTQVSMYKVER